MAKNKFGRTDIPFKDRLLMNKYATIADHRDHAALVAMKIAMVALNDTKGMGYIQLCRFAERQHELTEEYYTDPDYQEEKLNQRLVQMGFKIINGRVIRAVDEEGNTVPVKNLEQ